ncbi:MAG: phospholipase D-like domain-containing protein, partial [Porticoccaceae bacterium]
MMQLAMSAQEQVVVQTPYATTNPQMLDWLDDVGQHVPVTLVTNSMASSQNYPAFSNYAYSRNKFMEAGTSLYEYQSSHSIHGKTMLVDDRMSIVGSLNMDDRSLYLDTEIMLAIDSVEFSAILTDAIQDIQQQCLMVDVETNRYHPDPTVTELSVGIGKRLMMFLFSLLSRVFRCWI